LVDRGKKGGTAGQLRNAPQPPLQHDEFLQHDPAPALTLSG
jgi:hypothetical protein